MKRQGIILCITITAIIGSMFCTGCTGKDTEPAQTAASVPAATEEGNRIITEGMLSPQIIPDEFTSKVLDEKACRSFRRNWGQKQYMTVPIKLRMTYMKSQVSIPMIKVLLFS